MLNCFSHVQLFATLCMNGSPPQASLSMEVSRQEYWSGLPCPPPVDLLDSRTESMCLMFPALVGRFFTTSTAWKAPIGHFVFGFISFCRGVLSSTKLLKVCAIDKHAPQVL